MAYVNPNFKTKRELKEAVKAGKRVVLFQPGGVFPTSKVGKQFVEGPHSPQPHTWYATVEARELDGQMVVVKVIS
jgi:hypothetical protein